jgi:hypothetical protein
MPYWFKARQSEPDTGTQSRRFELPLEAPCHVIPCTNNTGANMAKQSLLLILVPLFLVGCTGTQIKVKPEPMAVSTTNMPKYDIVGLQALSSETPSYGPSGNLTEGFASAMKEHGFAKQVAYPMRPDEKVDIAVDTQFNIKPDLHSGANAAKGFFTGLTLFLIEPVVWFDQDYVLEGKAVVTKNGQRLKDVTARTDANISTKWLSLGDIPSLEAEALSKAKKSLYLQLMKDIR